MLALAGKGARGSPLPHIAQIRDWGVIGVLFRTLGALEAVTAERHIRFPAEKPRRLLSMLLLRANHWVPDGELIEVVWPLGAPSSARGNLKSYVSQLRRQLSAVDDRPARIERQAGAYRITVDATELDTKVFEQLVDDGRRALEGGEAEHAATRLTLALDEWRGQPFEALDVEPAAAEVARLTEVRWSARRLLAEALVASGDRNRAVSLLRAMTTEDPLREQSWLQLVVALSESGRRAEALQAYHNARRALVDELGIEPGAGLRAVYERLLREDETAEPPLAVVPGPSATVTAPRRRSRLVTAGAVAVVLSLAGYLVLSHQRPLTDGSTAVAASATTAAERYGWGEPVYRAEFTTGLDGGWTAKGPDKGRDGQGRRLPQQVTTRDGVLVITGTPEGDTGYLNRRPGMLYGRWEARVRAPKGCTCYRPVLTLWPDEDGRPDGSELVYLESFDGDRRSADFFLGSSALGERLTGHVEVDLGVWNTFAVEWTAEHVICWVNGEEVFRVDDPRVLPAQRMRPSIKLDFVPADDATGATMEVDWIREYPIKAGTP